MGCRRRQWRGMFLVLLTTVLQMCGANDPPLKLYPKDSSPALFSRCEGDCDGDVDCHIGLSCHKRSSSGKVVPGCSGNGYDGEEFCYVPPPGVLVLQGNGGSPKSAFPLGECEADCDGDDDCKPGLKCFRRVDKEAVPGCRGLGISGQDYCYKPNKKELIQVGNAGKPKDAFPLGECEADCDSDDDCGEGLSCFLRREDDQEVPGCTGQGVSGLDYCYRKKTLGGPPNDQKKPAGKKLVLAGNAGQPKGAFPLGECEADCDGDADCGPGLSCFFRSANETVPGCADSGGVEGMDYCYKRNSKQLTKVGNAGKPADAFPLGDCEGDCDSDADCDLGLVCQLRKGDEKIPGCSGKGLEGIDYCFTPPSGNLVIMGDAGKPKKAYPLSECEGACRGDTDCQQGLVCYERTDDEIVPGCMGRGVTAASYCSKPTSSPLKPPPGESLNNNMLKHSRCSASSPCSRCEGNCHNSNDNCEGDLVCFTRTKHQKVPGCAPGGNGDVFGSDYCFRPPADKPVTYVPGELSVVENGLLLSTGLTARLIAEKYWRVSLDTGGKSDEFFHALPDGAAVYEDKETGGWVYVSNSENGKGEGGVGAISFNANGEVVGYKRILNETRRNCGGGKTFWNTWLSCEEMETGQVWEVDPFGKRPGRQTIIGGTGQRYEAAAYDNRDKNNPKFFVTIDMPDQPLIRFTPDEAVVKEALRTKDYSELLHANTTGTAKVDFLVLNPYSRQTQEAGTFLWSDDIRAGRDSAFTYYQKCEGIDAREGKLFFTCKKEKVLFTLDLDKMTYKKETTQSGAFQNSPDQVARILGNDNDILYFCEAGGDNDSGVHGRDGNGNFFTIFENAGQDPKIFDETTGLAFSPDNRHMYVAYQAPGLIFDITRVDGYPFGGQSLDIKYHADSRRIRGR